MSTTLWEDIKAAARQTWQSPIFAATVLALGVAMIAADGMQSRSRDMRKTLISFRHTIVATVRQRVCVYPHNCIAVRLPIQSAKDPIEIGFAWDARMEQDRPVLSVTLILPGYSGCFTTYGSDNMA